jgi:hypothetical protein
MEEKLEKLPGRVVLGSVEGKATQLVTRDDVPGWVADAFSKELQSARYEVRRRPDLPAGVSRGVVLRIVRFSADQSGKLLVATSTDIRLAAEVWKGGRLAKTISAGASGKDEAFDRSGEVVADSITKTLQAIMRELVPEVVNVLSSP